MTRWETYTMAELREHLWATGAVPSRWMLYYIKKDEYCKYLRSIEQAGELGEGKRIQLDEQFVKKLRQRQANHLERSKRTKKNRALKYGTDKLTVQEVLKSVVTNYPDLQFVERRAFPDGFQSETGATKAKHGNVFRTEDGEELLFTLKETEKLTKMGLSVPKRALERPTPLAKDKPTSFGDFLV